MRPLHKLSAAKVRAIKTPGTHRDGGGLYVVATPSKSKGKPDDVNVSYKLRFEIDGVERWMRLGSTRDVSLGEARDKAAEARNPLAMDLDPITQRHAKHGCAGRRASHRDVQANVMSRDLRSNGAPISGV